MTQSNDVHRPGKGPGKGPSLQRSVALTAVAALVAISAIFIAYAEIRGASLTRRHAEASVGVQADLVNTMLDLHHERLGAIARQIAVDPVVDAALLTGYVSAEAEEVLRIVRERYSERPNLLLVAWAGQVIASAGNGATEFVPAVHRQTVRNVPQTQLLTDSNGSPVLAHRAPVRRGDITVGAVWAVIPIADTIDEIFPRLAGLAYQNAEGDFRSLFGTVPETGVIAGGDIMRAHSLTLPDNDGRRLDATVLPLQFGTAEAIGELVLLRDISDALRREELFTMLAFTAVLAIMLMSLGLLLQQLRIGFRPLGAVVQLLGAMSSGETRMRISGFDQDQEPPDGGHSAKSTSGVKSGREIDTLLRAVDSFRSSLDARNALIAVTEQLENARRIQQSLLPATFSLHPELDIHGRMRPALEVAGDFFDMFLLSDGRVAVLIADVSGKGMAPALFAAQASALLRAQCQQSDEPAKVIEAANNALCERNPEDMFLTAILAVITPETGQVTFVNAGHCPPMIADPDGNIRLVTTDPDMVLGVLPDLEWTPHQLELGLGERLLFYSDGLDEAQTADGGMLGTEGAVRMFKESCALSRSLSSKRLCDLMIDQIDSFAAGAPQADDISILVLHRPVAGNEDVPSSGS